jgi:hypothetical protein
MQPLSNPNRVQTNPKRSIERANGAFIAAYIAAKCSFLSRSNPAKAGYKEGKAKTRRSKWRANLAQQIQVTGDVRNGERQVERQLRASKRKALLEAKGPGCSLQRLVRRSALERRNFVFISKTRRSSLLYRPRTRKHETVTRMALLHRPRISVSEWSGVGEQYKRSVYCEERSNATSPCLQNEANSKRWRAKPTRILARRPNSTTIRESATIAAHFSRAKDKMNKRGK